MSLKNFIRADMIFAVILTLTATISAQKIDKDLKTLGAWMTGSWDTFNQVETDEEADAKYRHIRALMHVLPVEIPQLKDGLAFYVENQQAEARTKPYRQRVYYLFRQDGKITLRVFRIKDDKDFINAHKNLNLLKTLTFDRLTAETGCDLTYEKVNKNLFKGTNGMSKACKSSLRGATWTHSESEISPDKWINLDQGFDDADTHKWGPPPGTIGHIFIKRK
jgi:CpeT protein